MSNLNALTLTALSAQLAKEAKKCRSALPIGDHEVSCEVTLSVNGTVKVSEDELRTPTTSVPLLRTLALALSYAGVTGDAALNAVTKAMNKALSEEKDSNGTLAQVKAVEKRVAQIKEDFATKLPKAKAKGKVSVKAAIEEVVGVKTDILAD